MSKQTALASLSHRAIAAMWLDICGVGEVPPPHRNEDIVRGWQARHHLTADGWPGTATLRALWLLHRPAREQVIAAALAACEWPDVAYKLGTGGYDWLPDDVPLDACDCSGLVAHVFARSRNATGADLGKLEWIETTQLLRDGQTTRELVRALPLDEARPGDLVCYGDRACGQGHVGVVVDSKGWTVDCSSSSGKTGSAIRLRDRRRLWASKGALALRPVWYA
jgi:cell wall-associated NlpC family hydrolase